MENNPKKSKNSDVEVGLIVLSVTILIAFIAFMILNPDGTLNAITKFFNMMISGLGPFFEVIAFVAFAIGLYFCFGKYGKVRLGNCKPEYSNFSYFSMMLLASLASAALYWSFTEWASYYQAPGLGMAAGSVEAMESALGYQFFHWGIVNQSMYTIMGVAIAYGVYVRKVSSFQTSAVCCAMLGEKVKGKKVIGKVIDFLVIFGILGALSSSLGLAVPLATGGLTQLFGIQATPAVQIGVIVFIAIVYTITSFLGTKRGMQTISNIASIVCVVFLLYVLFMGPTTFILKNIVNSFGHMLEKLPRMALFTDPINNTGFVESWTIYFVAFYLNYVAMMGIFIAKVSKGRTIREVAIYTMFIMTAGGIAIFGVNGSFSIFTQLSGEVDVIGLVASNVGDVAIYSILKALPLGSTLLPLLILILIVGFVAPSMDSASLALAETVTKRGTPKMALRLFFCVLLAIIPMSVILAGAQFTAIKNIAIIISAPFLVILAGTMIGLLKWLKHDDRIGLHAQIIALQEAEERAEILQEDEKLEEVKERELVEEKV
ncbi:BCCT family transporter [Butyricicoccus sp. Marseille-Q5471]|uniref:BCCT family transporter n=1 Tax=Butyricicoccus sp. Marseille-Q5471 TaxID=3039493 RepID=UPI0024BCB14A|nr:BCCT family transporter [Butyricicoccus sp. Marseille-Q5471]